MRKVLTHWILLQADRDGRYLEFAEAYDNSRMKVLAIEEVTRPNKEDDMTEERLKELSVQRATTTSFFFGLKTLTKVTLCLSCMSYGNPC